MILRTRPYALLSGVIAISTETASPCRFLYPSAEDPKGGSMAVMDGDACTLLNPRLVCHQSRIVLACTSARGDLLATASEKGTVIRVARVHDGTRLIECRRGTMGTHIYSLCFDPALRFLLCTSASNTVHVFRLDADAASGPVTADVPEGSYTTEGVETGVPAGESDGGAGTWYGYLTQTLLPTAITSMWRPQRYFAVARLTSPILLDQSTVQRGMGAAFGVTAPSVPGNRQNTKPNVVEDGSAARSASIIASFTRYSPWECTHLFVHRWSVCRSPGTFLVVASNGMAVSYSFDMESGGPAQQLGHQTLTLH